MAIVAIVAIVGSVTTVLDSYFTFAVERNMTPPVGPRMHVGGCDDDGALTRIDIDERWGHEFQRPSLFV